MNNYTKYRDEIIHIYKTKSLTEADFRSEKIIQNLQNQHYSKSDSKASKDEMPSAPQPKGITNEDKTSPSKPPIKKDNVSEYEKLRLKNIAKREALIQDLKEKARALGQKYQAKKRQPKVPSKTKSQSIARRTLPKRKCKE